MPNISVTFSQFIDVSLRAVKFPDISTFSRQVRSSSYKALFTDSAAINSRIKIQNLSDRDRDQSDPPPVQTVDAASL